MRRSFMIEALLLSIIGAIVEIFMAYSACRVGNLLVNRNAAIRVSEKFDIFSMPLWLVVVLLVFMIFVGLLVAYLPARRAQRISKIDALRRELYPRAPVIVALRRS
jgi:ABC-type antimicrobial peptide transport system permease subunit